MIAYSWVKYNEFLQILAFIGTYAFNLLSITLFLLPSIILFNNSFRSKLILIFFSIFLVGTNFYYGQTVKNKYNKLDSINLDTTIKIISPKINIDRFFQNEDPYIIINELIELVQEINFIRNEVIIRELCELPALDISPSFIGDILTELKKIDFSVLKEIDADKINEEKNKMFHIALMKIL